MFDTPRTKLTQVETKVKGVVTAAKAERTRIATEIKTLGKDAATPLMQVEAEAKKTDQGIVQAMAPLKTRAKQLIPPGR